jgi:hypothetical protein
MPRSFREVAPGRIRLREGGGCMALFGLPFLCAGIFVSLAAAGVVRIENARDASPATWPLLALLGTAFTVVGSALVFGRSWITLDATRGVVEKQWGLLVPMRSRTYQAGEYSTVTLAFEAGDSDTADKFPVSLHARTGASLPLCSSTQYPEARAWASVIARHLRLEIEDATTDHPSRVPAGAEELPIRERLRTEGAEQLVAERPAAARSEVTTENGVTTLVIPSPRFHPAQFALMALPAVVPLVVFNPLAQFFRQTKTPDPIGRIFLGFLLFMFIGLPWTIALNAFVRSRRGRTIVTISGSGVRVQERGAWFITTTASHQLADIIDLDYSTAESSAGAARRHAEQSVIQSRGAAPAGPVMGPNTERILTAIGRFAKGRGVTLKTMHGLTSFGQGQSDAEIVYLYSVVRRALLEVG